MKIETGKKAPHFSLKDKDGKAHSLKDFDSDYTVVYFYPKDSTPGCTIEAQFFTKILDKFKEAKTNVVGISGGDEETKKKFCDKHNLTVTLLSDPGFKTSKKYGVYGKKAFLGRTYMGISRTTFLLDKNKKIIKIFDKVDPAKHPEEVLEFIEGK